jgi:hypothetical protein
MPILIGFSCIAARFAVMAQTCFDFVWIDSLAYRRFLTPSKENRP